MINHQNISNNEILSSSPQWRKRQLIQYGFLLMVFFLGICWRFSIQYQSEQFYNNGYFISAFCFLLIYIIVYLSNNRLRWKFLIEHTYEIIAYKSKTPLSELRRYFHTSEEEILGIIYELISTKRIQGIIENDQFISSISKINQ